MGLPLTYSPKPAEDAFRRMRHARAFYRWAQNSQARADFNPGSENADINPGRSPAPNVPAAPRLQTWALATLMVSCSQRNDDERSLRPRL